MSEIPGHDLSVTCPRTSSVKQNELFSSGNCTEHHSGHNTIHMSDGVYYKCWQSTTQTVNKIIEQISIDGVTHVTFGENLVSVEACTTSE